MNALAGGASFVTLPALIAAGVPSVNANTTSTVALYPGQLTSSWAYRDGLGPIGPVPLRSLVIVTLVGGALGAALLLRTPASMAHRRSGRPRSAILLRDLRRLFRRRRGHYDDGRVEFARRANPEKLQCAAHVACERRQCHRGADLHRSSRGALARSVGHAGRSAARRLLGVAHRPPRACRRHSHGHRMSVGRHHLGIFCSGVLKVTAATPLFSSLAPLTTLTVGCKLFQQGSRPKKK
jgi:Sulfite exporter TauE/SafE